MGDRITEGLNGTIDMIMTMQQIEAIEAAGWLVLDLAEYLRELETNRPSIRAKTAVKRKFRRELGRHEKAGDPLQIVDHMRKVMGEVAR